MPSRPSLRPLSPDDAPALPPRHAVEPAGVWKEWSDGGRHYPAATTSPSREEGEPRLRSVVATGWSHQTSDGDTQMEVRDRIARA